MRPSNHTRGALIVSLVLYWGITASFGQEISEEGYADSMCALKSGGYDVDDLKRVLLDSRLSEKMDAVQERAYLNEVMNKLRQTAGAGDGVKETLVALARDSSRDTGVREYALQHLGLWVKTSIEPAEAIGALWGFTGDPTVSSAAILQLHHLGGECLLGREAWCDVLVQTMNRGHLRDADKVTLLLVAAESRVAEVLPRAKEWTLAAKDTVLLKCAIHAVGVLGTQEDMEFLDAVRTQKDLKDVEVVWVKARERLKKGGVR